MEKTSDILRKAGTQIEHLIKAFARLEDAFAEFRTALGDDIKPPGEERSLTVLSKRQKEIFLLMKTKSTPEIAKHLQMSKRTVETHLNSIRNILKFPSMYDLRKFAKEMPH